MVQDLHPDGAIVTSYNPRSAQIRRFRRSVLQCISSLLATLRDFA